MHLPRVSVGLPVCNGANFIAETLRSLTVRLGKTWKSLSPIMHLPTGLPKSALSSVESIHAYATRAVRRRLRPADNHNRAFVLCSGQYFKWAAHDDVCAPEFLAQCVPV